MSQPIPRPPAWVHKRDGRIAPFEADKISSDLFAASEDLGQANAFLARELTQGILHFLSREFSEQTPTTVQITEFVAKIARELGHPRLAQTFLDRKSQPAASAPRPSAKSRSRSIQFRFSTTDDPEAIQKDCLKTYTLHSVYSRDLAAAHRDGLISLLGLDQPTKLVGLALPAADVSSADLAQWIRHIQSSRERVSDFLALERLPTIDDQQPDRLLTLAEMLDVALQSADLDLIVNLNGNRRLGGEEHGPLFQRLETTREPSADAWYELLTTGTSTSRLHLNWHLSQHDFQRPPTELARLGRLALEHPRISFTFDRPRHPVVLGEGLDRDRPAVLTAIALNLPRLVERLQLTTPSSVIDKLPTLALMAISAGVQKRNYLRQVSQLTSGFVVDRARLTVLPVGLEDIARSLLHKRDDRYRFVRQTLMSLQSILRTEGAAKNLDAVMNLSLLPLSALASGPATSAQAQIEAAEISFQKISPATATVILDQSSFLTGEQLVNMLHYTWRSTALTRIRFSQIPLQQASLNLT